MAIHDAIGEGLQAARAAALVVEETAAFGALVVRGGDRRTWLNGLVTCDLTKLAVGQAIYGLAVTPKGRVLSDLLFIEVGDRIVVLLPMTEVQTVASAFDHYLVMEDAELETAPEAYRIFTIQGPKSEVVRAAAVAALGGGVITASFDRFGLGGGVVIALCESGEPARDALAAAARAAGGTIGSIAAIEALRLEQGVPRFGADFGPSTYPQEAGLEQRAVSFDKGCYLGQEVVCMLQLRGHVKRKLVSLQIDEGTADAGASIKTADGQAVGELTSIAESPSLGRPIGIGMVKLAFTAPGTTLRIGDARAHVVATPLA